MNNFRLLRADEIDCRVAQIKETGLSLLLYKDARCDMNILDETVGPMNWMRGHSRDNANCTVHIWDAQKEQWIGKEDTGTESNTEAQKGLASDSFKRACFNWGIGRELYTAPFIWIGADKCSIQRRDGSNKPVCYDSFEVERIAYNDNSEISGLSIINSKTRKRVFVWQKDAKQPEAQEDTHAPETANNGDFQPECVVCRKPITVKEHDYAVKYFKRPLCRDCQKNESKAP